MKYAIIEVRRRSMKIVLTTDSIEELKSFNYRKIGYNVPNLSMIDVANDIQDSSNGGNPSFLYVVNLEVGDLTSLKSKCDNFDVNLVNQ